MRTRAQKANGGSVMEKLKGEPVPSGAVPYYYDEENNKFLKYPWHHLLFNQCRWYHKLTGGNWKYIQLDSSFANWQRLKWVSKL
jgi:hypothetical protein